MREIKFRAWDGKSLSYGGFSVHATGKASIDFPTFNCSEDELVVMQFTGLKDKNGEDIYEGDVINFDWRLQETSELYADDCENIKGVVRFQSGKYVVRFFNDSMSFDLSDVNQVTFERFWRETYVTAKDDYFKMTGFEVIGNIYQNPELLNEE